MTNTDFKAKNKANQSNFKKAIQWLKKYNESNKLRDIADSEGDEKAYKKWDKRCENEFDKYLDYCSELPKYEVKRIEKSELY